MNISIGTVHKSIGTVHEYIQEATYENRHHELFADSHSSSYRTLAPNLFFREGGDIILSAMSYVNFNPIFYMISFC